MKKLIRLVALFIALMAFSVAVVSAHEGGPNGVTHQVGTSGPIIGGSHCGMFSVWHKGDGNGELAGCTGVFLNHGVVHVFPVDMKVTRDYQGNLVPGCTCEPTITEQGGDS